MDQKTAD